MRISTNKSNKKIFIIITAVFILLSIGVGVAYYFKVGPFTPVPNDSVNLDPASDEQKATGDDLKQNSLDQVDDGKSNTGSDPSPAPQPIENSDKKSIHAEITAANQDESSLHVRVLIQTVTNEGVCNLTMTGPQGHIYREDAAVQALPSSSTCKGFDIPLDQLSPGAWTIKLDFNNDNLVASTSKELIIK